MNKKKFLLYAFLSTFVLLLGSCDNDDAPPDPPDGGANGELFAFLVNVAGPDGIVKAYLQTTPVLNDSLSVDVSDAIGFNGPVRLMAPPAGSGYFLVSSSRDLTLTRWEVNDDNSLTEGKSLSLVAERVRFILSNMAFVSDTKAYYVDPNQGRIIIIDPREMAITGRVDLPEQLGMDYYEGLSTRIAEGPYPLVDGKLFIPVGWLSNGADRVRQSTGVAIVDVATDQVSYIEDDRLAFGTAVVAAPNGDLYFGPSLGSLIDGQARAEGNARGLLRIRAGDAAFDPDYFLPLPEVAVGLLPAPAGGAFMLALDQDLLAWGPENTGNDFFDPGVWRLAALDIGTGGLEILDRHSDAYPELRGFFTGDRVFLETFLQTEDGERHITVSEALPGNRFEKVYECSCMFILGMAQLK